MGHITRRGSSWQATYRDPTGREGTIHGHGTEVSVEQHLRLHVYPLLGDRPIGAIRPTEVQGLVKQLSEKLAPSTLAVVSGLPGEVQSGAGLGLRPGELFGLATDRVEFLKRVVRVDQQLVWVPTKGVVLGPLKTSALYRSIPLPEVVGEAIAAHLQEWPCILNSDSYSPTNGAGQSSNIRSV